MAPVTTPPATGPAPSSTGATAQVTTEPAEARGRRRWILPAVAMAAVAAAALAGLAYFQRRPATLPMGVPRPPEGTIKIAVLPFDDHSLGDDPSPGAASDEAGRYFAQGLSEEMIFHLSLLAPERLKVIARTSVEELARRELGVRAIGEELDVHYLLEGSVRATEDRVHVTATLVQVSDQTRLWSDRFEGERVDLVALQSRIAGRIADSLTLELLHPERASARRRATTDAAAYDAYLRARYEWNRFQGESLRRAAELLEGALERDPDFGLARASLAEVLCLLPFYGLVRNDEGFARGGRGRP